MFLINWWGGGKREELEGFEVFNIIGYLLLDI